MFKRVVEFKIEQGDLPWEQIPVLFRLDVSHLSFDGAVDFADEVGQSLSAAHNLIARWEIEGVGQGHYFHPTTWVRVRNA